MRKGCDGEVEEKKNGENSVHYHHCQSTRANPTKLVELMVKMLRKMSCTEL